MKNLLKNSVLVLASFILAFLATEAILRFLRPAPLWMIPHEALMSVHPAGAPIPSKSGASFDELGFVNENVLPTYDIVTLGDSHTEGEVRGAWPIVLSSLLDMPVYNMGVAGYGVTSYTYLVPQALSFHPKLVIIGLYIGNDIFDTYDAVYHLPYWSSYRSNDFIDDAPLDTNNLEKTQVRWKGVRDLLHRRSMLYGMASHATRTLRERLGLATPHYLGTEDWSITNPDAGLRYSDVPSQETVILAGYRLSGLDMENKNIREGLRIAPALFSEMAEKVKAASSTLVVAILPTKGRVYYARVKERAETNLMYSRGVASEDFLRAQIIAWCTELEIVCIDILPTMETALALGETIYYHDTNDHPNQRGQEFYAKGVAEGLKRLDLVP